MRYNTLGGTGLLVSEICLGTMTFGGQGFWTAIGSLDQSVADRIVAGALDKGLKVRSMTLPDTFIDQDSPAAMYAKAGLDAKGIVTRVFEALGRDASISAVQLA